MINKPKKFTRDDRHRVESIWQQHWHRKSLPEFGLPEMWLAVIKDFLNYSGYNLITPDVEELELIVAEKGLADDYYAKLAELTAMPFDLTEGEKFIHLLHSSADDREKALKFVLQV